VPRLKRSYFLRPDVVAISRELIGKRLFTHLRQPPAPRLRRSRGYGGQARKNRRVVTGGIIVETEAYAGPEDRASHAYGGRRTRRNEVMYHAGGVTYVYLCYGIHSLLNFVTNTEGIPHAVLIRAVEPADGIETMLARRDKKQLDRTVAGGPGALTMALGIDTSHNGLSLAGPDIWLEDGGTGTRPSQIEALPRVGIAYAGSDAALPWRFRLRNSPWTSKAS